MELHPWPPGAVPFGALRDRGQVQAIVRGPRTIEQVLTDARRDMEMEDLYCAWLKGEPLPPRIRHPRRTLRQWLFGRQPETLPAPNSVMSSVEPVWLGLTRGTR